MLAPVTTSLRDGLVSSEQDVFCISGYLARMLTPQECGTFVHILVNDVTDKVISQEKNNKKKSNRKLFTQNHTVQIQH